MVFPGFTSFGAMRLAVVIRKPREIDELTFVQNYLFHITNDLLLFLVVETMLAILLLVRLIRKHHCK